MVLTFTDGRPTHSQRQSLNKRHIDQLMCIKFHCRSLWFILAQLHEYSSNTSFVEGQNAIITPLQLTCRAQLFVVYGDYFAVLVMNFLQLASQNRSCMHGRNAYLFLSNTDNKQPSHYDLVLATELLTMKTFWDRSYHLRIRL